jgi:hypothetical protein
MRRIGVAAAIALAGGLAACSPEIEAGVYFCGPDEACPSGFVCDGATNTCVTPTEVTAFTCTEGDPLIAPTCDPSTTGSHGCVTSAGAHDSWTVTAAAGCAMHFDVMITYPVAFMPLAATVTGQGTTQPCHGLHDGLQDSCLEFDGTAGSTYTIDVAATDGASTCAGACAFNRYQVAVQVTRP